MFDCLLLATPRIRRFILVMTNTGLRANEARQLQWRDVNLEQQVLTVANSKTHRSRLIPLNVSALTALRETAHADGPSSLTPDSFVFNSSGRQLTGIHEWEVAKLFKRLGIRPGNRLHAFRHYFASKLIARGADAATVKELLGHASIQMTMDLYVHLFPDQKRKAVALLDD